MLDKILNTAKDFVVLGKSKEDKIGFAFPFEGDIARDYYKKTIANAKENNLEGFDGSWEFDDKTGLIKGSSTFLALKLDEQIRKDGLWIPTPKQAMLLDKKEKLSNDAYRDYGIVIYSEAKPNKEVAKRLIQEANKRGWKLPILAPFKALDLIKLDLINTEAEISFKKDVEGIITGEEARQYLDKELDYQYDSGACGLGRYSDGSWDASGYGFDDSNTDGRVDFVCGEATHSDLKEAHLGLLKRQHKSQIDKLLIERDKKQADFEKSLKNY